MQLKNFKHDHPAVARLQRSLRPYGYLSPVMLLMLALLFVPIILVIGYSFFDNVLIKPHPQWVGLQNYIEVLTDPVFLKSMKNTAVFVVCNVVFHLVIGMTLALMVNARHLFYGLSMLGKFKGLGWKRPYLIFGMCDETFAINSTAKIPAGIDRGWFYFWVTLCNQLYWVTGATLGGLIGAHLPFNTDGLDFVLTALFLVIFLDQWLDGKHRERLSAVIGVLTSLACLLIFGANDFMIPSMIAMLILFVALRPHLDVLRPAADAPEATANHAMSHAADQQKEGQTR